MHHHDAGCFMHTSNFSAPCDDFLTMLVCATCWLYLHLYMLAYMSIHESCLLVCHPYFNTMKLCMSDPNLHLSLANTTFCLLSCLFAFLLVCLLSCLLPSCIFACILVSIFAISILLVHFSSFYYYLCIFLPLLVCWFSYLCLYMYTREVRTFGAITRSLRHKQKGPK